VVRTGHNTWAKSNAIRFITKEMLTIEKGWKMTCFIKKFAKFRDQMVRLCLKIRKSRGSGFKSPVPNFIKFGGNLYETECAFELQ
jgi:hypothetical protein